jgi:hypothetical protein
MPQRTAGDGAFREEALKHAPRHPNHPSVLADLDPEHPQGLSRPHRGAIRQGAPDLADGPRRADRSGAGRTNSPIEQPFECHQDRHWYATRGDDC